jgi:hypothetical protein
MHIGLIGCLSRGSTLTQLSAKLRHCAIEHLDNVIAQGNLEDWMAGEIVGCAGFEEIRKDYGNALAPANS